MSVILKFLLGVWLIFAIVSAFMDGGTPLRNAEDEMHQLMSRTLNAFADQADHIKDQADSAKEKIRNLAAPKEK
jgi:hypothetical protein